jgi:septal ring factor EnvC (AmiA/AmiB activator)
MVMMRHLAYALVLFLVGTDVLGESPQEEIKKRQAELQGIRDQITALEGKIKQHQQNESEALELLDTYDRKATLVRRLIRQLRADERELQQRIEKTSSEGRKLASDLAFLQDQYARYVTSAYKAGRTRDMELLLSSKSINQFYVRTAYLRMFSAQRKRDAEGIAKKKSQLEEMQAHAQQQLTEERRLIAEKAAEEDRLTSLAAERRTVLQKIRKDKNMLQQSIDRQMRSARELESVITSIIEADRIKRERAVEEAKKSHLPLPQPRVAAGSFEARRGKLRWPVSSGTVVARFGNQRHPTLRTVTVNTGIDIAVDAGTPVTAIAEGEVAKIFWIPSYGNLVILNHESGYRSVYSHLAEITVAEGQHVKEGDVIAQSGESLDGPRLHFEIWKDRDKQNPESWLSRQ